ncbi:MAG: hypothetical protein OXG13_09620 [Gemmatimonadaceae bacterium]|nr:hypothetical protein [Gemmatimonadaceae bacterium]
MKLLSADSFDRARTFVVEQGREMDRRLLSFHFEDGPPAAVLEELANYQNEDGGFGRGLEPDVQMPGSSVLTTTMALRILREVKATSSDEIVRKALEYLMTQYDSSRRVWPIVPQEVDEFPHAPWWNFENTAETFGHFLANPRAEVVGYLHQYQELAPAGLTRELTEAVVEHIAGLPDEMNMYDFICCVHLVETPDLPQPWRDTLAELLTRRARYVVAGSPEELKQPSARPLWLAPTPTSVLAETLKSEVEMNLDFDIEHQNPDGSWSPAWSWYGQYPEAWERAEQQWKSCLTVEVLKALREFGRIEGLEG